MSHSIVPNLSNIARGVSFDVPRHKDDEFHTASLSARIKATIRCMVGRVCPPYPRN